jgi:Asp-tRNA(Asn)/Glu-tRNA(Gln) amidotransferase A subunit family amidase
MPSNMDRYCVPRHPATLIIGRIAMPDPSRLTATEAARRIAAGTLDPEALLEACLARIAEREGVVRAFTHLDAEGARRAVRTAPAGRLHGLPFGAKDTLDSADMPTTYGSPVYAGWRPRADAAAIAWARQAGGVLLGKTASVEFACGAPAPTTNPHNPAHTPGGSSSGSAAAVADFFLPLAIGTQTGGSVIRPSAFCGVVGYKPSFGLISRSGLKPLSDSLDTVGVMARAVADCALFASVISGQDLGDPDIRPGRPPRIGLCRTPLWDQAVPETQALLAEAARAVARAGAQVVERELPAELGALDAVIPVLSPAECSLAMAWEHAHARDGLSESMRKRLDDGLSYTGAELLAARAALIRTQAAFPAVMEGLDMLLTPSAPGEAPEGLGFTGRSTFNGIWTALYVPCVTVPAGTGPKGLPLGVQIVGRRDDDRAVLAWAQWVAAALG